MNKYEYFADDDDGHDFAGTSDLAGIELAKRRAMEDLTDEELEDKLAADLSVKQNYAGVAGGYDDFTGLEFESSGFTSASNYLNSESGGTKFDKSSKAKFKGRDDANLSVIRGGEKSATGASYGDFVGANFVGKADYAAFTDASFAGTQNQNYADLGAHDYASLATGRSYDGFAGAQDELLRNYDAEKKKEKNLTLYQLLVVYLLIGFAFLLTVPAIYIRNEIYYISRDIAALRTKHEVLLEENRALNNDIEYLRYKNEILDPQSVQENGR
ncbi:hypothetical protein [uncultured Campylobacter sp.]|mgnify:FL=1|uniref:hypothetical protein n=1 Tax=uncultured Campylobacter sp. TaxID=218934 RepID=UPI002AB31D8C|nr:hypothetical protein [uncultured Campylobacter sp.]